MYFSSFSCTATALGIDAKNDASRISELMLLRLLVLQFPSQLIIECLSCQDTARQAGFATPRSKQGIWTKSMVMRHVISRLRLPRRLLSRSWEHGYGLKLVETAAHGLLIMLPSHARGVVDKGTLSEGICTCRLWDQPLRAWSRLLHTKVLCEGVCPGCHGL